MIETTTPCRASAAGVHRLLVDIETWALWSPHVASVSPPTGEVHEGWRGSVRAFFSPTATEMHVTRVRPDGGYAWESHLGPWRLAYDNRVEPIDTGSTIRFTAELSGPAAELLERLVAPLSARGQRRRTERLARLAELVERGAG
ncbi:MAG: SRPBCC family protein [Actinomycetota bacterium]